ncbi:MAG: 4-(cytidine 5'-diphospho)-2-C-methyl-D-erythritol kinase [Candidatus Syntrophosphaera sp.]|nr:4-(cytidine 5'-diphospho)-2-C-methyl-D-erythritol kinase [Candidatus Syntrophosphaera sp.]
MLIASYAKVNLFLEVLARLPDNYHQIETLLCSVSVCDTLKFALTKRQDVKLWSNLPEMAVESNLVYRVAAYLMDRYKPEAGIDIYLEKRIPLAAGLGGGSSNAANTIRALNSLWKLELSLAEMEATAALFGSDIGFFLHGGTAWATNRGELVEPCADLDVGNILLVNPNIAISSASAYAMVQVPAQGAKRYWKPDAWRESCFNRLEASVRKEYREVDEVIARLLESGAMPAQMSGSGSTCLGVFQDAGRMRACQSYFDRIGYWTKIVRTISRKEYQSVFKA